MRPVDIEAVADYDAIDEDAEELEDGDGSDTDAEPPIDPKKLEAEIGELEGYRTLALAIGQNAKGLELSRRCRKSLMKSSPRVANARR